MNTMGRAVLGSHRGREDDPDARSHFEMICVFLYNTIVYWMYMDTKFLYLDESGDGGWPRGYGGSSPGRYFIYAGIVMNGEQNFQLRSGVEEIIQRYFLRQQDRPEELHYADLIHNNGSYSDMSDDDARSMSDDVFDLIKEVEPTLMGTVADKQQMRTRYGDKAFPPKRYAFRATVDGFNKHLETHNSVGTVTIDVADRGFDRRLRQLVYDAQDSGIEIAGSRKDSSKVPHIMDTITMSPSEMSPGIQIADYVAYVMRHEQEYGNSNRYEEIKHLLRDPDGVSLTEPSIVPA